MRTFKTFLLFRKKARLAFALAAVFGLAATAQAQPKIGIVDLKKVFEGYYKTKQADALLADNGADADKVLGGMFEDYKKGQQDYNKLIESANDQAVSTEEREKRRKSAENKVVELKEIEKSITQYRKEAETRILEQKRRMWENIVREIQDEVTAQAKSGAYTYVIDSSALSAFQTPVFLYNNGQSDLTTEVLAQLNAKAPPGALTAEPKEEKNLIISPPKTSPKEEKPPVTPTPAKPTKKK